MSCICDRMLNGGQIVHRNRQCQTHGDSPRTVTVGRVLFPVPLEQAPQCVELMVDCVLRGSDAIKAIERRARRITECCGDPADCIKPCDTQYDHWYRQGPRP